jgi:hypothetical protein
LVFDLTCPGLGLPLLTGGCWRRFDSFLFQFFVKQIADKEFKRSHSYYHNTKQLTSNYLIKFTLNIDDMFFEYNLFSLNLSPFVFFHFNSRDLF